MSFKSVQKKIAAKEHIPMENAAAILAHASMHASAAAKRKNPNLLKVGNAQMSKEMAEHAKTMSNRHTVKR